MPVDPQLRSNNPFRKKIPPAGDVPPISTASNSFDEFFLARPAAKPSEEISEAPVKPKVVKKVRVQSPPPSSPETGPNTPAIVTGDGRYWEDGESSSSPDTKDDPFENVDTGGDPSDDDKLSLNRPPPNPFSKTLHDLEQGPKPSEQTTAERAPTKGSLNVDSFRQLLLTGRASTAADTPQPQQALAAPPPQSSTKLSPQRDQTGTDSSSVSRHSLLEPPLDPSAATSSSDSPRTSHEIEHDVATPQPADGAARGPQKKKPPPPSSRHGKLIKIELREKARRSPPVGSISPSDVNKPLPPAPIRKPADEDTESIFDRESLGKVPEPEHASRGHSSTPSTSSLSKKPMPAPPPRRRRTEERSVTAPITSTETPAHSEDAPRRSSGESTRSNTTRHSYFAPAPPPPRRPNTGGRLMSSFASPSTQSFGSASPSISDAERSPMGMQPAATQSDSGALHIANVKLAPPPPPPARSVSTRRPQSASSMEGLKSRPSLGGSKEPAPPPPPRRQRGGSRSSLESADGHGNGPGHGHGHGHGARRSSDESQRIGGGVPVVEEPLREVDEGGVEEKPPTSADTDIQRQPPTVLEPGHGDHILADLDALQREVNDFQRRYSHAGGEQS